mmetsp:Transcript_51844/g.104054  ORF Transcript_51844/g.104054 Transcript_51844/m.104054 type:complete len:94 (-) Transcript_51844:161-442(-)
MYHPDKNRGKEDVDKFKSINEAYICLSDTDERQKNDRGRWFRPAAAPDAAKFPASSSPSPATAAEVAEKDQRDRIFAAFFQSCCPPPSFSCNC